MQSTSQRDGRPSFAFPLPDAPTSTKTSTITFAIRPASILIHSPSQSNQVKPCIGVATACRHNVPPLPGTPTSMKTPPSYPSKWPKTVNHAVLGSTPAPGVVFRALAETRARRGISSVRVKFTRTTANCRTHSATPFVIQLARRASALSYFKLF